MKNGFAAARKLHQLAMAEFRSAAARDDRFGMRQAAEKGWLASVEATKALLRKERQTAPSGTRRQLDELFRLTRENRRAKPLLPLFALARERLHIACFYDDDFTPRSVEGILREEIAQLIDGSERCAAAR